MHPAHTGLSPFTVTRMPARAHDVWVARRAGKATDEIRRRIAGGLNLRAAGSASRE